MTDAAQLERETEQTRAALEGTLDELRARITPGQIVDQLMDRARDGKGGEFVRNFGQQIAANPIPVAVVGVGLAWLMMASKNPGPRRAAVDEMYGDRGMESGYQARNRLSGEYYPGGGNGYRVEADGSSRPAYENETLDGEAEEDSGGRLRDMTHEAADRLSSSASAARESLGHMAEGSRARISDTASSVRHGLQHGAATARHGMQRARVALTHSASEAGVMSRRFYEFCKEQPLIVAGLGLALGAALGAMLPATRMEDELVGDASDDVRRRASGMADRVASEATSTWQSARDSVAGTVGGSSGGQGSSEHGEGFAAGGSGGTDLENEGPGDTADLEFQTRRPQQDFGGTPTQHRIVE